MPTLYPSFRSFLLSGILFCALSTLIYANVKTPEHTRETCQKLIDESREDIGNNNYANALEKLLKAEITADQNKWDDLRWYIKNRIGIIYTSLSSFAEALEYYQESYAITRQDKDLYKNSTQPLSNIGLLYFNEKNYDEALHYCLKAYDIVRKENGLLKKHVAVLLANVYNRTGQPEKSLKILNETKADVGDPMVNFIWKEAYIDALFINGEVVKAEKEARQLSDELRNLNNNYQGRACHACLAELMSRIYAKQGQVDLAINYIRNGLKKTDELPKRIELYERISDLYLQKGQHQAALQYKDSVVQAKDSLSSVINRNLYEANKARFKVQEYQNDLIKEKERKEKQRNIFIGIVASGLFVFFLIYKNLKNNIIKQRQKAIITDLQLEKEKKEHQIAEQQKLLVEKKLETTKLKQQQLKHEIAEKNRELTAKALYLSNRNELIHDVINSVEANSYAIRRKDTSEKIKVVKNFLKTDHQWNDFIKHFESVNPDFLKRLKEKHPLLTSNDIRFLCYVYMNLSIKEISMVFNITYNTCVIRKQRVMDKMGLDKKKTSLYDYVLNISQ